MSTHLPNPVPVDGRSPPLPEYVDLARDHLASGGLLVVPTETVYGLAADPSVPGALDRLYDVKQRPSHKEISRMVATPGQVEKDGALFTPDARRLAEAFWPGPLTLVLHNGTEQVGYRIPDHAFTLGLLEELDTLLAVTSANRSGEPAARSVEEARATFGDGVAVYFDGGPTPSAVASTVVSAGHEGIEILRAGALSEDTIRAALT